ncbi:MAG: AMP-binding protein [Candidatus Sulfotelmatobacter sp.]
MLRHTNLIDALEAAPGDRPFVTAWINEDEQETVTFAEFRRRARLQAAVLSAHGVTSGDRVIVIMPQGIPAMTVFAGAMMLGAVPALIAYPNDKFEPSKYRYGLAGVTANLSARLVVIDKGFPDDLLSHVSLGKGTGGEESKLLRAGDGSEPAGPALNNPEIKNRAPKGQANPIAFIQHSAGTTGLQKGVALTHAAVLRHLEHLMQALEIDSTTDRIYSWLPLYHDMGLIACFMLPMTCHIPVVMQSPMDWVMHPETMLQIISEHKCTLGWMPNFAYQFVPRRTRPDRRAQYDLSSVRALINTSEPVRISSMQEFQDAFAANGLRPGVLQTSYGMAENVFAITQSEIPKLSVSTSQGPRNSSPVDLRPARIWADGKQFRSSHRIIPVAEGTPGSVSFTSSGRLLPNHEMRVVSEAGNVLADAEVGEILVKSDCLFDGYYNRPDLTAKAMVDGWFRSGDLGFTLDGEVFVVGRKKDLIIVGGENIYPQDIEEIASSHPDIRDGRVIAMGVYNPDLGTEEIVVVAEVENEKLLANAAEIEREIRSRIIAGLGVTAGMIFLKPPKWIVKSTAGKAARSTTLEKLQKEHPEFNFGS